MTRSVRAQREIDAPASTVDAILADDHDGYRRLGEGRRQHAPVPTREAA